VADRALRARFGPERCWSPSQLEQYARCPFQFFVQRVLGVEPVEEPALEIDYLGRGRILHWLLAELHRRLNVRAGAFRSPADETVEEFRGEVRLLAAEFLKRMEGEYPLDNGLLELDVRRVAAWLGDYRRQHVQYDAAWREWPGPLRPAHFEVPFGPSRHSDEDELPGAAPHNGGGLASSEPFELVCGGETMRFSGRIDRIDVGWIDDQMVFNVVDYKSGRQSSRTSGQSVAEGYSLQLPLYALAAKDLLGDKQAVPFRAAYWHVGGDGYKEIMKFSIDAGGRLATDPGWTTFESRLRGRILALVEGIRRGQFPMHSVDEKCTSRCEYSTICRVNQSRSLDKTWQPPSEGPP
jgi:RecB family exonuclease